MISQFSLMTKRRFLPLFITQFMGAFNDNFFKTALVVMIAYGLIDSGDMRPEMLVTVAAGIFILPFVLLTPLGGDMADKFDKSRMIRIVKLVEIALVLGVYLGFMLESVSVLLLVLFSFGAQSAVFSPSKFAILPAHLGREELIGGNALINTGAYLAILLGNILGTLLAVTYLGQMASGALLLACALVGYVAARNIPPAPAPAPDLKINYNTPVEALRNLRYAYGRPDGIFTAMLCSAWFFFVGGLYLAQLPNFTSQILGADNIVLTFFLALFSLGVGLGGLLNNMILRSKVQATFVPYAALGMALLSADLFFASHGYHRGGEALIDLGAFLSDASGWRIAFDFCALAVCGGLYQVPLKAIMQDRTPASHIARTLAGSAMLDATFVLLSSIIAMGMFAVGLGVAHLFIMVGILGLPAALYSTRLTPELWARIRKKRK
ncbi:MAG: MFS transporter [Alphaproteobacteria bacterium]|nr:MFS transporter [Alphaproteobacteria bacterium]